MAPPEPKRCLGCGYIVDGLPEPRGPECGRGFDPDQSATYAAGTACSGWSHVLMALAGAGLMAWALVLWEATFEDAVGLVVVASVLQLYVAVRSFYELWKPEVLQPHRGSWLLALVLSVLAILGCMGLAAFVILMLSALRGLRWG